MVSMAQSVVDYERVTEHPAVRVYDELLSAAHDDTTLLCKKSVFVVTYVYNNGRTANIQIIICFMKYILH